MSKQFDEYGLSTSIVHDKQTVLPSVSSQSPPTHALTDISQTSSRIKTDHSKKANLNAYL